MPKRAKSSFSKILSTMKFVPCIRLGAEHFVLIGHCAGGFQFLPGMG
jgi:hypothetical protein